MQFSTATLGHECGKKLTLATRTSKCSATSFLRSYLLQLRLDLLPCVPEYLDGCLGHLFILHLQTLKQGLVGLRRVECCGVGERQHLQNAK